MCTNPCLILLFADNVGPFIVPNKAAYTNKELVLLSEYFKVPLNVPKVRPTFIYNVDHTRYSFLNNKVSTTHRKESKLNGNPIIK